MQTARRAHRVRGRRPRQPFGGDSLLGAAVSAGLCETADFALSAPSLALVPTVLAPCAIALPAFFESALTVLPADLASAAIAWPASRDLSAISCPAVLASRATS